MLHVRTSYFSKMYYQPCELCVKFMFWLHEFYVGALLRLESILLEVFLLPQSRLKLQKAAIVMAPSVHHSYRHTSDIQNV